MANSTNILDGYTIVEHELDVTPSYVQGVNPSGVWYIRKWNDATGPHTFVRGTSDPATNWTNRATFTTYKSFHEEFSQPSVND